MYTPRVKPVDDEIPRDIMDSLHARNVNSKVGRNERVLMIDKASFIYPKQEVKSKIELFTKIDPEAKIVAEKALGCFLRSRLLGSGDGVIFCLPKILGGEPAVNRGIQFLKDWERKDFSERNVADLSPFIQILNDLVNPACAVDSGMNFTYNIKY
jgi:hypothetical protein